MPTLQELASEGVHAEAVRSVFPSLTYPAHTTIVTGALPARHGIFHNRPFESAGQTGRWIWEASAIRSPTLWDAVRTAGGTTAAISWPVTVGADIDWNIPDVWPLDDTDSLAAIREATRPVGLLDELEREAVGRLRPENFGIHHLGREDRVGGIGAYLFEKHRPTLMLVHCIGTDHIQHEAGRDNPKTRRSVGAADRAIGQILEAVERLGARDRTAFILTGDHGSASVHTQIRPNVWLAEAGLMEARPNRGSWRATFFASGGSAFLRLRDRADRAAVLEARQVIEELPGGIRRLVRIIERAELDQLGADPDAELALSAVPGVEIGEEPFSPAIRAKVGAAHGYLPDEKPMLTGFVASGAGVRKGLGVPLLPIETIAPLVASLLRIELVAPDGVVFPGLLT
jgi:predicted AlkP superfamily pyrophosphatase or phosphodiesterase